MPKKLWYTKVKYIYLTSFAAKLLKRSGWQSLKQAREASKLQLWQQKDLNTDSSDQDTSNYTVNKVISGWQRKINDTYRVMSFERWILYKRQWYGQVTSLKLLRGNCLCFGLIIKVVARTK